MKKFLVAYTFVSWNGSGNGRTFGTAPALTEDTIKIWEQTIKTENRFQSVAVYNVVQIEG